MRAAESGNFQEETEIPTDVIKHVKTLAEWSNHSPLTVLLTSLVKKSVNPDQDVRLHQAGLPDGYSGRSLDAKHVTPFLARNEFPYMRSGSGWLTRSFEQPHPYDLNYPGKIKGKDGGIKKSFLKVLDYVESGQADPRQLITYMFKLLIQRRDVDRIPLSKPTNLTISQIISYLARHFECGGSGKARLPVLAIYAIYQQMVGGGHRIGSLWRGIALQKYASLGLGVAHLCRF